MSFDHKAFAFDWALFERELGPLLSEALATNDATKLRLFVDANAGACASPDGEGPLGPAWKQLPGADDVQQVGDIALTKYYDPSADNGLANAWSEIEAELSSDLRAALLGSPFGPDPKALFDPGRMGSYFQSAERVRASLAALREREHPALDDFIQFLETVVAAAKGLYVTF